jgi:hypothetical protein
MAPSSRRAGLTLVEMSLVAALTIVGISVLGQLFVSLLEIRDAEAGRSDLLQMGRLAAARMTAELRLARSFTRAEADRVDFTADLGSGTVALSYRYYDPGSDGVPPFYAYRAQGAGATGQPLAVLLESSASGGAPVPPATPRLEIRYHDAAGNLMTPPLSAAQLKTIRLVGITLTLQDLDVSPSPSVPQQTVELRWAVAMRDMDP